MEDAQTGDHWTYELRDDITGELKSTITNTVTDVSDSEINVRVARLGNSNPGYQTFDRSWNVKNSGGWRYTPNDGTGIRAPLAVGKSWSFKSNDLNSTAGVSWKRSGTREGGRAGKRHDESGHIRHLQDRDLLADPKRE